MLSTFTIIGISLMVSLPVRQLDSFFVHVVYSIPVMGSSSVSNTRLSMVMSSTPTDLRVCTRRGRRFISPLRTADLASSGFSFVEHANSANNGNKRIRCFFICILQVNSSQKYTYFCTYTNNLLQKYFHVVDLERKFRDGGING